MSKKITPEEIRHIAHLARLKLTEEEMELFSRQLADIIDYVGRLSELDLSAAPASISADGQSADAPRPDEVSVFQGRDDILSAAPSRSGEYYKVKKVIE